MIRPMRMKSIAAILILFYFSHVYAHMEMSWPYPFRSKFDPTVPEEAKDYSMTTPLLQDGTNFPCKLYHEDGSPRGSGNMTYDAGGTYSLTLNGTATHGGGSCQISLSCDNGATFKVIKSIIGGCPLTPSYDFTTPSFVPASDSVLLSWSWFNLIGNREMYQNCARVNIRSGSTSRVRRQSLLGELPNMYVCNVNNNCTTDERQEVVFPEPGLDILYG